MSVIVELSLPAAQFQLGEILVTEGDTRITLETMVPTADDKSVPFFRTHGAPRDAFEATIRAHPAVSDVYAVTTQNSETLYALDWTHEDDTFFRLVVDLNGNVLEGTGSPDRWEFQLRFPSHDALSQFQEACFDADVPIDITRIYNPTVPDAGPWYGLTERQRRTLRVAVERGYYSLPRRTSTKELAAEFDVSDQAVTERLRRGIQALVTNTLLMTGDSETE